MEGLKLLNLFLEKALLQLKLADLLREFRYFKVVLLFDLLYELMQIFSLFPHFSQTRF